MTSPARIVSFPFWAYLALLATQSLASCKATPTPQHIAGVALPAPYHKPNVWLQDTQGKLFNFPADTKDKLTIVEFGYTHCPDVCPVTMANIAAALARQPYEFTSRVKVYFVTQDPARDTPPVLRKWLDSFNPNFVGVTGPKSARDSLTTALGISAPAFDRRSPTDTTYEVGHAALVIVFTPDNLAHFVYPFGVRQEDWVHDLPKLALLH